MNHMREPLSYYLNQAYPYTVTPDLEDGGFVIHFPDLPGCMTQVDDPAEIASMADEIRVLWLRSEYAHGDDIPLPVDVADYSGKFVVRLPRSLHRALAESAERDGVSLNAYVTAVLARGDAQRAVERRLDALGQPATVGPERLAAAG